MRCLNRSDAISTSPESCQAIRFGAFRPVSERAVSRAQPDGLAGIGAVVALYLIRASDSSRNVTAVELYSAPVRKLTDWMKNCPILAMDQMRFLRERVNHLRRALLSSRLLPEDYRLDSHLHFGG